jgi:heme-degrading monooxygenase HmoA
MYARIGRFRAPIEQLEKISARFAETVAPNLKSMNGNVGSVLLVDHVSGLCAVVTYWESEQHISAADRDIVALRTPLLEGTGSTPVVLELSEIVLLHGKGPAQPNTFVRMVSLDGAPDRIDAGVSHVKNKLPEVSNLPGFRALLIGAVKDGGRMYTCSVWDTAADREASLSRTAGVREELRRILGAGGFTVEDFETRFIDIRQPVPY